MYDLSVSDVKSYMTGIAYQISGLCIWKSVNCSTDTSVCRWRMRKADTEVRIYTHDKSGTVSSVCKTGTAIHIRITDKLLCKLRYCRSDGTALGSIAFSRLHFTGWLLGCSAACCLSCCFLFCIFLGKTCFLFCLGFCLYKLCGKRYIISGNVTFAFLDIYLNPTVFFFADNEFIVNRDKTDYISICTCCRSNVLFKL